MCGCVSIAAVSRVAWGGEHPGCACRAAADASQAAALVQGVQKVFDDACAALEQWHEDLLTREKKNAKLQLARGAVPASVQQAFDEQKTMHAPPLPCFKFYSTALSWLWVQHSFLGFHPAPP